MGLDSEPSSGIKKRVCVGLSSAEDPTAYRDRIKYHAQIGSIPGSHLVGVGFIKY